MPALPPVRKPEMESQASQADEFCRVVGKEEQVSTNYQIYPSSERWTGWSVGRIIDNGDGTKTRHMLIMTLDGTEWVDLLEEAKKGYVGERNTWESPGLAASILAGRLMREEESDIVQPRPV